MGDGEQTVATAVPTVAKTRTAEIMIVVSILTSLIILFFPSSLNES